MHMQVSETRLHVAWNKVRALCIHVRLVRGDIFKFIISLHGCNLECWKTPRCSHFYLKVICVLSPTVKTLKREMWIGTEEKEGNTIQICKGKIGICMILAQETKTYTGQLLKFLQWFLGWHVVLVGSMTAILQDEIVSNMVNQLLPKHCKNLSSKDFLRWMSENTKWKQGSSPIGREQVGLFVFPEQESTESTKCLYKQVNAFWISPTIEWL